MRAEFSIPDQCWVFHIRCILGIGFHWQRGHGTWAEVLISFVTHQQKAQAFGTAFWVKHKVQRSMNAIILFLLWVLRGFLHEALLTNCAGPSDEIALQDRRAQSPSTSQLSDGEFTFQNEQNVLVFNKKRALRRGLFFFYEFEPKRFLRLERCSYQRKPLSDFGQRSATGGYWEGAPLHPVARR